MADPIDDLADISFEWSSDDATMTTIDLSGLTASGTCPTTMASTYPSGNVTIASSSTTSTTLGPIYSIGSVGNLGIGAQGSTINSGYTISTSQGWNGTFAGDQPKLSIDAKEEGVFFKTEKHNVNWDELIDDINSIKRAFLAMNANDELMEKYPEIRDMLSEWLIRGLSK